MAIVSASQPSLTTNRAQVEEEQVLAAHAALIRSGTNAWQPLNFHAAGLMESMDGGMDAGASGHSEVQQALEQLLLANRNVSPPHSRYLSQIRDTVNITGARGYSDRWIGTGSAGNIARARKLSA